MKISKYVSLDEATKSQNAVRLGIRNQPNEQQLEAMKYVASEIFDPVREYVGGPLHASSFFRSKELNDVTPGSSKTSQHMTGEAVDIDADTFGFGSNNSIFEYVIKNLEFDQCIGEYPKDGNFSWVHVSKKKSGNRKQILVKLNDRYINYQDWKPEME